MTIDRNCKNYHRSFILKDFLSEPFVGSKWDMAVALGWSYYETRDTIDYVRFHYEQGDFDFQIPSPGTKRDHFWIVAFAGMPYEQAIATNQSGKLYADGARKTMRRNAVCAQMARASIAQTDVGYAALDDDAVLSEAVVRMLTKISQ